MSNTKTVMGQAANTLVKPLEVEDVFSTYLFSANNSTQQITNGIDLDGEGGLVWLKSRTNTYSHGLYDTERGVNLVIYSDLTNAEGTSTNLLNSFNSDGFTLGQNENSNFSSGDSASWTFRKAPKFFDVVTYTGTGSQRTVNHNLGSTPGMIMIKRTDSSGDNWGVWHRSLGSNGGSDNYYVQLNTSNAASLTSRFGIYGTDDPNDTTFTVKNQSGVNASGETYVAYLFAHNDGDGGFNGGDIIKCGSYTAVSAGTEINIGFEPQWIMIKKSSDPESWYMYDAMRGVVTGGGSSQDRKLRANSSGAEAAVNAPIIAFSANGFVLESTDNEINGSGGTYIYMAIRRGTKVPESGTEVFAIDTLGSTTPNPPSYNAGFPVDLGIMKSKTSGTDFWRVGARLTGENRLKTNSNEVEATDTQHKFDYQDGWYDAGAYVDSQYQSWQWKRAPKFFDVVAYTGDSNAGRTVSHNLTVAPEMMWVKNRNGASGGARPWIVYHKDTGNTGYLKLNETSALITSDPQSKFGNGTVGVSPTASDFTVAGDYEVNYSGDTYIAYLFASLPGISKVGSYTGNGTSQTIDCGFTSGARFVIVRDTTGGNWFVFDTDRGLTSSSSEALRLNLTSAEVSLSDAISPNSSGFIVEASYFNNSGDTYIFYAIA